MSRKGIAKKRKAERLRNKKLIDRYPWILPVNWHWKRIPSYDFTMYDDVPKGWKRAFGKIMLEEYREALIRCNYLDKFQWIQVKETIWIDTSDSFYKHAFYNKQITKSLRLFTRNT